MPHHLRQKSKNKPLRIAATKALSLLLFVAKAKGLLQEHGANLKIQIVPYGRQGLDDLLHGKMDIAVLIEANVAYMGFMQGKAPHKCFAVVQKHGHDQIITRSTGEVAPDWLKGKTIGFQPRTSSHIFLIRFLEHHGMTLKDVKLKPLSPQAMPSVFIQGELDAISVWQPYAQYTINGLEEIGVPYHVFRNTGIYQSKAVLAASKTTLVKSKGRVNALLAALKDALAYAQSNPMECLSILAQEIKMPLDRIEGQLSLYEPMLQAPDYGFVGNVTDLGKWITDYDREFIGQSLPDYQDCVDTRFFD